MEQLQVHSKSYIVRWINVSSGHSISWSLQPHKKSLNFGIFKHPGTKNDLHPSLLTSATLDPPSTPSAPAFDGETGRPRKGSTSKNDTTTVVEKLQSIGLKCVQWTGKCEADKVSMGQFDVPEGGSGMYGLVFDNTFSKQVSKTATFVLMTHPTNAPPKSGAQMHYKQGPSAGSSTSVARPSPNLRPAPSDDSLPVDNRPLTPSLRVPVARGRLAPNGNFHTGTLYKKRRKRNQGYAKRFFSLDFTSATLSYYRNGQSSALRGAIPLALAAIGVNDKTREFSIDSGAEEVWHLRVRNKKEFEPWRIALEYAASSALATPSPSTPSPGSGDYSGPVTDPAAEREWNRVEELLGRVSGSRDAVRRLAQDTDPKYSPGNGAGSTGRDSPGVSGNEPNPFFQEEDRPTERIPFWKRKPSSSSTGGSPSGLFRRSVSAGLTVSTPPVPAAKLSPPLTLTNRPKSPLPQYTTGDDVHERCMALLRDLDFTISEFSELLAESKSRRVPRPSLVTSGSRMSFESTRSEDFFDAAEGLQSPSQLITIRDSVDLDDEKDEFLSDDGDSETSSNVGDHSAFAKIEGSGGTPEVSTYPLKPKVLLPSEVPLVRSRATVPPPRQPPPSIIGFLRKNAGKDLSTVSMPVSANEPTSLLQRLAEPLETAYILTTASSPQFAGADQADERLLYVAAFAVSTFSSNRVKERAIRKPFNPMLGETYELVRHETSSSTSPAYRFIAEKVSHHPVRMAWQADSLTGAWSLSQSPQPVQKFWGKSVELNTEGSWRLVLYNASANGPGERFTWSQPTCFLRNVLAGEKYVEPVQNMTIINESTGSKAIATFKAGGMFAGRSEEVTITLHHQGSSNPLALQGIGKWTTGLKRSDTGATIWEAGPLVPDAAKTYGFTAFAAALNELTDADSARVPPTDSRLRPDQRALEDNDLDRAEALKARLEERQRARRKVLEEHGRSYSPKFFEKIGADDGGVEEVWRLKSGRDGYWECRERNDWTTVEAVFDV